LGQKGSDHEPDPNGKKSRRTRKSFDSASSSLKNDYSFAKITNQSNPESLRLSSLLRSEAYVKRLEQDKKFFAIYSESMLNNEDFSLLASRIDRIID